MEAPQCTLQDSIIQTKSKFTKISTANLLSNTKVWSNHQHCRAAWSGVLIWRSAGRRFRWTRTGIWFITRFAFLSMLTATHPQKFSPAQLMIYQHAMAHNLIPGRYTIRVSRNTCSQKYHEIPTTQQIRFSTQWFLSTICCIATTLIEHEMTMKTVVWISGSAGSKLLGFNLLAWQSISRDFCLV